MRPGFFGTVIMKSLQPSSRSNYKNCTLFKENRKYIFCVIARFFLVLIVQNLSGFVKQTQRLQGG